MIYVLILLLISGRVGYGLAIGVIRFPPGSSNLLPSMTMTTITTVVCAGMTAATTLIVGQFFAEQNKNNINDQGLVVSLIFIICYLEVLLSF